MKWLKEAFKIFWCADDQQLERFYCEVSKACKSSQMIYLISIYSFFSPVIQ